MEKDVGEEGDGRGVRGERGRRRRGRGRAARNFKMGGRGKRRRFRRRSSRRRKKTPLPRRTIEPCRPSASALHGTTCFRCRCTRVAWFSSSLVAVDVSFLPFADAPTCLALNRMQGRAGGATVVDIRSGDLIISHSRRYCLSQEVSARAVVAKPPCLGFSPEISADDPRVSEEFLLFALSRRQAGQGVCSKQSTTGAWVCR